MILWVIGGTASGKSTIFFRVIDKLGDGVKRKIWNIPCYSFNDILMIGRNTKPQVLNGLDGVNRSQQELMSFIDDKKKNTS